MMMENPLKRGILTLHQVMGKGASEIAFDLLNAPQETHDFVKIYFCDRCYDKGKPNTPLQSKLQTDTRLFLFLLPKPSKANRLLTSDNVMVEKEVFTPNELSQKSYSALKYLRNPSGRSQHNLI